MVVGRAVQIEDRAPLQVEGDEVEYVGMSSQDQWMLR